jgi:RNA-directed DNA polymerase
MRKRIKQSFARAVAKNKPRSSIASYLGWAKHCNSKNLIKKLLPNEKL